MSKTSFTISTGGKTLSVSQEEIDALKAKLGLSGQAGGAEKLGQMLEGSGMVTFGPAVELNPIGPSEDGSEAR